MSNDSFWRKGAIGHAGWDGPLSTPLLASERTSHRLTPCQNDRD